MFSSPELLHPISEDKEMINVVDMSRLLIDKITKVKISNYRCLKQYTNILPIYKVNNWILVWQENPKNNHKPSLFHGPLW